VGDRVYLVDRAGYVHVWNGKEISDRDPWTRAVCHDPGDFNRILSPDTYFKPGEERITCSRCRKVLGMATQQTLF